MKIKEMFLLMFIFSSGLKASTAIVSCNCYFYCNNVEVEVVQASYDGSGGIGYCVKYPWGQILPTTSTDDEGETLCKNAGAKEVHASYYSSVSCQPTN